MGMHACLNSFTLFLPSLHLRMLHTCTGSCSHLHFAGTLQVAVPGVLKHVMMDLELSGVEDTHFLVLMQERLNKALRAAGIEPWELSFANNSNCEGAPLGGLAGYV